MKKILLIIIISCTMLNIQSQTILNPSFENVNAPPCAYNLTNVTFNSLILNVIAFGLGGGSIISNACSSGVAQNGNWFIGLSTMPVLSIWDGVAVELSTPLISGQSYQFSLYQKNDSGYYCVPLVIGYSDSNLSQLIIVDSLPYLNSTTWTQFFVSFTPTINADYIVLYVVPGTFGWNHLDNLSLTNLTEIVEETLSEKIELIFPNPATDYLNIKNFDSDKLKNIFIYNTFGEKVKAFEADKSIFIGDLPKGLYFINLITDKGYEVGKFVKE